MSFTGNNYVTRGNFGWRISDTGLYHLVIMAGLSYARTKPKPGKKVSNAKKVNRAGLTQRELVEQNIRDSQKARESSNFSEYLKKEKRVLEKIEKTGRVVEDVPKRPSWQQSEVDAGEMFPNYSAQKSFLDGDEVSHGTKGSSRPEYYTSGYSVVVKNYKIETPTGRSKLAYNVSKQVNQRIDNLPQGTKQTIIIDVRGQHYATSTLDDIIRRISEKVSVPIEIRFME